MNAQPDMFGIHWVDASKQLPAPGQRAICIYHNSDNGTNHMHFFTPIADVDKENPYHGKQIKSGLLYWAEQPLTPVEVTQ